MEQASNNNGQDKRPKIDSHPQLWLTKLPVLVDYVPEYASLSCHQYLGICYVVEKYPVQQTIIFFLARRGHWAVYYCTGPQSFIIAFSYS